MTKDESLCIDVCQRHTPGAPTTSTTSTSSSRVARPRARRENAMALAMRCATSTSARARPLERSKRATRSGATTMRAGRMTDGDDVPTPNAIDWRLETVFGRSAMTGMAMLPTEEILGGGTRSDAFSGRISFASRSSSSSSPGRRRNRSSLTRRASTRRIRSRYGGRPGSVGSWRTKS